MSDFQGRGQKRQKTETLSENSVRPPTGNISKTNNKRTPGRPIRSIQHYRFARWGVEFRTGAGIWRGIRRGPALHLRNPNWFSRLRYSPSLSSAPVFLLRHTTMYIFVYLWSYKCLHKFTDIWHKVNFPGILSRTGTGVTSQRRFITCPNTKSAKSSGNAKRKEGASIFYQLERKKSPCRNCGKERRW